MNADEKNRYFQELTLNLQHEGFVVNPETEEGLLPVELDVQRLCLALDTGAVRYWKEDAADDRRSAALDRVGVSILVSPAVPSWLGRVFKIACRRMGNSSAWLDSYSSRKSS